MRTKTNSVAGYAVYLFTITVILISSLNFYASNDKNKLSSLENKKKTRTVETLKAGIASENTGLKKCSIYFAGLYEIKEAAGALVSQLKKEKDPDIRTLIALSLYRIGDEEGFKIIKKLAQKDESPKVKKVCNEICNEFTKVVNEKIVKINNTKY